MLVIGWDAADWQVINPLIEEGKMPTLAKLVEQGVSGNIATLNPPLSPMLWTSIATGKRAYDHGIHGFAEFNKDTQSVEPIKGTSRKIKAFWNILNEAELRTNIINWWPSHPAEKVNGISVSNFFHQGAPKYGEEWPLDEACIYPPEWRDIYNELRLHPGELTLAHIWPFIPEAHKLNPEKDKVLKPLIRVLAHCSSIHNVVTHALENTEWDLTAVYFEAIDHFSHLAMKFHPPRQEEIPEDEYEFYKGIVEAAYRFHDMMLERLLELVGKDCHIILLSDHGFQSGGQRVVELPNVSAAPALEHRRYGVFIAHGTSFGSDKEIYGASLLDIMPTILHFFDLPVAEDFEGHVLLDIWKQSREISKIPSWELNPYEGEFLIENTKLYNDEVLSQLEELGYLDIAESEQERQMDYELNYNLCQSLVDGNKLNEAAKLATTLRDQFKDIRSSELLAFVLLQLGDFVQLELLLKDLKEERNYNSSLLFIESQLLMFQGKAEKALQVFDILEKEGVVAVQLFNEMARAFLIIGLFNEAEVYYNKALALDGENAASHTGLSHCLVEKGNFEGAINLLDKSLGLLFFQPNAHYLMGLSLSELGYKKEAIKALELTIKQGPKHHKARALLQKLNGIKTNSNLDDSIVVVSGLPRSGTSMMMQFLEAGNYPILKDENRVDDIHNPKGYLEYEKVKSLGKDASWVSLAKGKALKVVSPLLRYLPSEYLYKVIWIKRPLTEVIVSQERMKGTTKEKIMKNFPFQMAVNLQKEEERIDRWIQQQANIQVLEIEYYKCLESPEEVLKHMSEFLGFKLQKEALSIIDQGLHRNKLGN